MKTLVPKNKFGLFADNNGVAKVDITMNLYVHITEDEKHREIFL